MNYITLDHNCYIRINKAQYRTAQNVILKVVY